MIDIKEKYFLIINEFKPTDFGLKPVNGKDFLIDENKGMWKHEFFWEGYRGGNLEGFVRLPEPNFDQLWVLLTESNIENNKLGAAELLPRKYPLELKEKLEILYKNTNRINRNLTKRLSLLEILNNVVNLSNLKNANPEKVNSDYEEWGNLKTDFDMLKTESIWKRIKKMLK